MGVEYVKEVKKRGKEFVYTSRLRLQAEDIARFLTEEKNKFGLLLLGSVGNGKTTMLSAICHVVNNLVKQGKLNKGEIHPWSYMLHIDARDMVKAYISSFSYGDNSWDDLKFRRYLAIDDLGKDQAEVYLYGTVFTPFCELLDYRYHHQLPTIIASNLTVREIAEKYKDIRLIDRMAEMFDITPFNDKSFRTV